MYHAHSKSPLPNSSVISEGPGGQATLYQVMFFINFHQAKQLPAKLSIFHDTRHSQSSVFNLKVSFYFCAQSTMKHCHL